LSNSTQIQPITAQQTFDQIEQELGAGMVPRIFLLLESNPNLLFHIWGEFREIILRGSLPRTIKEMVGLLVAANTHCDYVKVVHMHSLTLQGVDVNALKAISEGDYMPGQLSSTAHAALRFGALMVATRAAHANPPGVTPTWQELRQKSGEVLSSTNLTDGEKFELLATVAFFEQVCTIAVFLGLDPSQP